MYQEIAQRIAKTWGIEIKTDENIRNVTLHLLVSDGKVIKAKGRVIEKGACNVDSFDKEFFPVDEAFVSRYKYRILAALAAA